MKVSHEAQKEAQTSNCAQQLALCFNDGIGKIERSFISSSCCIVHTGTLNDQSMFHHNVFDVGDPCVCGNVWSTTIMVLAISSCVMVLLCLLHLVELESQHFVTSKQVIHFRVIDYPLIILLVY